MSEKEIVFEDTTSYVFSQLATAHRNRAEKKMEEIGLHSGQVFILFELWKNDGQTQISLAKSLNVAPPTVNKMLGNLAKAGFVQTGKDEGDARSTRAYLTEKGREIRGLIEEQWRELEQETLVGLTDAEAHILYLLLAKLHDHHFGRPQQ